MSSFLTRCVQQRISRKNTCINYWATSDSSLLYSTEDLLMGGHRKIFILDVTTRVPLSLYSRSRMETALEDSLRLSGNLLLVVSLLLTVMQCCLTCLAAVTSQPNKQEGRYNAIEGMDLDLQQVIMVN